MDTGTPGTAHFPPPHGINPMTSGDLLLLPLLLVTLSTLIILISQNWRYSILALALQYVGVFWLINGLWPLGLAVVKLVAGWMACAVLSASQPAADVREEQTSPTAPAFRLLAAVLALALVVSVEPSVEARIPVNRFILMGGLLLISVGWLHLGITTRPIRVIIGLLTVLSGFEILYAAVETSILIAGLQAAVTLGLALVGAYLIAAPTMEETP